MGSPTLPMTIAINVSGPGQDLHSGLFGRMVHEPMTDLIKLMSKLVGHNGDILIPGIEEVVALSGGERLLMPRSRCQTTKKL